MLPKDYARPALNKVMLGEAGQRRDLLMNVAVGRNRHARWNRLRRNGAFEESFTGRQVPVGRSLEHARRAPGVPVPS
ncbi:MAG: hypothetical protein MO853_13655 [Candidatus Protistobacter heckmanni]|nr:hypothetical protein [Candidatus Protistobacter heckmanni]